LTAYFQRFRRKKSRAILIRATLILGWMVNGIGCARLLESAVPSSAQSPAQATPQQPAPAPSAQPAPSRPSGARFVVVLDAAHGGDDSGGQLGGSVAEKTVTLALSVRLRSLLAARGFSVITTREGNVGLDSDARAQVANHATLTAGSSACISLHASQAGTGVHIFVSSLAIGSPTRFLAWKTAQSAFVARSLKLAGTINSAFEQSSAGGDEESGGSSNGPIPATLGRASLPGVDSMTCPAVAIEVAPLRGQDGKVITEVTDAQYQAQVAQALAASLLEWKTDAETEPRGGGRLP
jgi:N-acetylmuramoyl-L-alanine amidase